MDLAKGRSTDLPGAKDLKLPGPVGLRDEIKIQCRSQTYMDTLINYMCNHCDNKGICEDSNNLTQKERAGLDELREVIKSKGWIVYTTDKSGKMVLDTKENFLSCMEEHYRADRVITP